jgi:hypothetical protein
MQIAIRHFCSSLMTLSLICSIGCAEKDGLESTRQAISTPATNAGLASARKGKEFVHHLGASRFHHGGAKETIVENALEKTVGAHGVFARHLQNNAVLAVSNADSPALALPPLSRVAATHSARVVAYFKDAQIPADEISSTHVTTAMEGRSEGDRPMRASDTRLLWYTTHLERQVAGIPIADSQAWAAFNSNDEVVAEGVHWPEIPESVVQKALELTAKLSDGNEKAKLKSKIRAAFPAVSEDSPGRILIRHTPPTYSGPVKSMAVFEVSGKSPAPHVLDFDAEGQLTALPVDPVTPSEAPLNKKLP